MENIDVYIDAKSFHTETWAPERGNILRDLISIRDDIQKQRLRYSLGCISYVTIGLLSGSLALAGIMADSYAMEPLALVLTMVGLVTGILSGGPGLILGGMKIVVIKRKCALAMACLEKHEENCKKMKAKLNTVKKEIDAFKADIRAHNYNLDTSQLKEEIKCSAGSVLLAFKIDDLVTTSKAAEAYRITGNKDKIVELFKIGDALDDLLPIALKDVSEESATISTEVLSTVAAIGILIDIGSLIWNVLEFTRLRNGMLCNEAESLNKVIVSLQREYDVLERCFI